MYSCNSYSADNSETIYSQFAPLTNSPHL